MLRHHVHREDFFPKDRKHSDDRAPDDPLDPVEPAVVIRQALFELHEAAFERDAGVRVRGFPPPLLPLPEAVLPALLLHAEREKTGSEVVTDGTGFLS